MAHISTPDSISSMSKLLLSKCTAIAPKSGRFATGINRLHIVRYDTNNDLVSVVMKPSFVFMLQGFSHSELALFQKQTPQQTYSIMGVQLPVVARVRASNDKPLILMVLNFDLELIRALSILQPPKTKIGHWPESGVTYGMIDYNITKLLLRLLDCQASTDNPLDLTPPEIIDLYTYFLDKPQGVVLRKLADETFYSVINSIYWFNDRFNHGLSVAKLAKEADMPLTTYHRYFKQLTSLSPIQ